MWPTRQRRIVHSAGRAKAQLLNYLDIRKDGYPSVAAPTCCRFRGIPRRSKSTWSQLSRRETANVEDLLRSRVGKEVNDPILNKDLASLDWINRRFAVSEDGTIQILLKIPSLLHPMLDELKASVKDQAEKVLAEWKDDAAVKVNVEAIATKPIPMMAQVAEDHEELLQSMGPGLINTAHFVAVYSCKGGVGKSTVAVNLAYELARMGGRVGLVDLDIYGPSLPVLINPSDVTIRRSPVGEGMVYPIAHEGVKVFSLGYVNVKSGVPGSGQDNGAAIMRGPMAGKVVSQMLKGTDWGDLDVLILDLPPGTGDVQLEVCQDLQLSGAVAVTTPSKMAVVDTRKGIEMFSCLGVPTLSVVENMAYFVCDGGTKHYPFGVGMGNRDGSNNTSQEFGANEIIQLPISATTNGANDSGQPICLDRPEAAADELVAFTTLAKSVSRGLMKLQYGQNVDKDEVFVAFDGESHKFAVSTVHLAIDNNTGDSFLVRLHSDQGAVQKRLSAPALRGCDPKTGEKLVDSPFNDQTKAEASPPDPMVTVHRVRERKSPSLQPSRVDRKGHYGYAVVWNNGETIIYSKLSIARCLGGVVKQ